MEKNLRLPKFISPRNPFKQEPVAEPASPPPAAAAPAVPIMTVAADVLPPAKKISLSVRVGGVLEKTILFCLDHNPFSAIGQPKLSRIPRFGKSAQQTELALNRVKVAQNDLSHGRLLAARLGRE